MGTTRRELSSASHRGQRRAASPQVEVAGPVGLHLLFAYVIMALLKNAGRAIIDERKLTHYVLNPAHPRGREKARIFKAALGYDRANYARLIEQIRIAILAREAVFLRQDRHGNHYRVDLALEGPRGTAQVRTGWIYDRGSDVPRLTTAFVLESAEEQGR